jgi:glutamyl-tRNA reductase
MHIVVVGVDHTTAPIALREQLACSPRQGAQVLEAAQQVAWEAVLLSTWNHLELYALCSQADEGRTGLLRVLSETRQIELAALQAHCYGFADGEAVRHLFEVACGLHSLIAGESEIQGQVAEALACAQDGNAAGPILSALFRAALVAARRAGSETGIGRRAALIEEVGAFERWFRSLSVVDTVSELRQHVETFRNFELARAMRQLSSSLSEREAAAIQELSTRLINKLLHTPTLRFKEAAAAGQGQVYAEALRYLFALA